MESLEEMLGEAVYDIIFTDEQVLNYMKFESFHYSKIIYEMKTKLWAEYEAKREEAIKNKVREDFLTFAENKKSSKDPIITPYCDK